MKPLILIMISILVGQAYGQEILKVSLSNASLTNLKTLNKSGVVTGCLPIQESCYRKEATFPVISLGSRQEPQENGSPNKIVEGLLNQFYPEVLRLVHGYPEFVVQNFATDMNQQFVVELDFVMTKNGDRQSLAVFGDYRREGNSAISVNVTSYSELNDQQESDRKNINDLYVMLQNPDFIPPPRAQLHFQDNQRAQAVGTVIAAVVSAMPGLREFQTAVSAADIR